MINCSFFHVVGYFDVIVMCSVSVIVLTCCDLVVACFFSTYEMSGLFGIREGKPVNPRVVKYMMSGLPDDNHYTSCSNKSSQPPYSSGLS